MKDGYGYEVQKKERSFYVEESKEIADLVLTPIIRIKNVNTDEITKHFNYDDEFEISVVVRNRTINELHFGLDISFDVNDLSPEKCIVPPKKMVMSLYRNIFIKAFLFLK